MTRRSAEFRFLLVAAIAGLVHAAFSLYWALGGDWLLPTVGQWAVDYGRDSPLTAGVLLACIAVVKAVAAIVPVIASRRRFLPRRLWRGLAWLAAVVLTVYGALNSIVAWLVLGGVVRAEGGFDRPAMIGHAYLWDPLFLIWGLALGAGLLAGRGAARRDPVT